MKLMEELEKYRAQESVLKQRVVQKQVCNCKISARVYIWYMTQEIDKI